MARIGRGKSRVQVSPRGISRGLLVMKEYLDQILAGTKTWEIRGRATSMRGPIALIQSKSGLVVGRCEIVGTVGPLSLAALNRGARKAGGRFSVKPYKTTYAWVVRKARRLRKAVPYIHPSGAVIWVRLAMRVRQRIK